MNYTLPKSLDVCGRTYPIRWDFRPALDLCAALCDPELSEEERALAVLLILYPNFDDMPAEHYQEALEQALWFFNGGETEQPTARKKPVLMNWEQDFPLLVAPVSRVLGQDVRGMETLHWWSFLAAYMEIGECTFAQVVAIRAKKAKGQKLEKAERDWYRQNRELVDLRTRYTESEDALLALWGGAKQGSEVSARGDV